MKKTIKKTLTSLIIGLILIGANQVLIAQNFKKTYTYIQKGEIEKADLEVKQFTEKITKSDVDFTIYGIARCLIICDEKYQEYDPFKSLEMFEQTEKINADKGEVNKFLSKYDLSIEKVQEMIYQSILKVAKKVNTEESYQKALDVCQECFFKAEVLKLKEEAINNKTRVENALKRLSEKSAFEHAKNDMSISSLDFYINKYSNSENIFIPIATHLRDSVAFSKLNKTYSGYLDFIKQYPNSELVFKMREELPNLLFNQASQEKNIDLYELFIKEYSNDNRRLFAETQVEKLLYEKLMGNKSSEEFADFKKRFPNSDYLKELEANIEGDYEYFTDSRDSKIYKTIRIGNQVWMAENLRYEGVEHVPTPYNISDWGSIFNKVSRDDYSKKYGESYYCDIAQNVCPSGWHLPSKNEWEELFIHVNKNAYKESTDETRYIYWYGIADYLMNRKEFESFYSIHNFQSKFNVLATGDLDFGSNFTAGNAPQVINKGLETSFWTSTSGARRYLTVHFTTGSTPKTGGYKVARVTIHDEGLGHEFVRCVKNK
jgi:uncharacterized protein (TIGR02145 family)